ncbi:MAG: DM13 domain-containing protein [Acidimicrobiia bacterium]|nr:DM13 domain-containing protein [Acidimicrobiia bacterium]
MTETQIPPANDEDRESASESLPRTLIGRITRLEIIVGALIAAVMLLLVLLEPDILEAPFENERTLLFTVGGTVLAAVAFVAMLWLRVPAVIRVIVLVVPFVIVNWWLLSPYFIDDVVDEEFSTSISAQLGAEETDQAPTAPATPDAGEEPATDAAPPAAPIEGDEGATASEPTEAESPAPPAAAEPVLLGAGQFVGLAGHSGTGDAGIFQNPDGSLVLRFENFDIENGPDLEVYLVPGPDQTSLPEGSIHLGALKGNIGDQNYELPPGTELAPGEYTVLVWCEAFSVEFVGATIAI